MRFIDVNGDRKEHYEEVNEYARQRQKDELRYQKEKKIREWFAVELDNKNCLKIETGDLIKYIIRETQVLKKIFYSFETQIDENIKIEQLWNDFLLYNLNLFTEYFVSEDRRKEFVLAFSEKILCLKTEVIKDFLNNYNDYNPKYKKYMTENFLLDKNSDKQFWRLLCHIGGINQIEQYTKEYIRFIYFYVFYLYMKVNIKDFNPCKKELKQCKIEIQELLRNQKSGRNHPPDLKKIENPLYRSGRQKYLQKISYFMKVILFCLNKKPIKDGEGEFEMIEELYRQVQEKMIIFDDLNSIVPEEIKQEIYDGKLPEFHDYDFSTLQKDEKVHYLDHTVLYQGKEYNGDIEFVSYKGLLFFTDKRIIFKGKYILDLRYGDISRVTEYDVVPNVLEIKSGNKINYFQFPEIEVAYKVLKLIANCKREDRTLGSKVSLSYEELVEKADIKAYIFAFEYMISGNLPEKLKEMLMELNFKLHGLRKTIEKNPQCKEEIYQFLHYYIPETIRLVWSYQSYQETGLTNKMVEEVYEKVETAVLALDRAVYQKVLEIYQASARDTIASADALKEILGQDGYVDSSYTIDK